MNRRNVFAAILYTVIFGVLIGVGILTTYEPEPVTHENCKVTGTHQEGGTRTFVKHYIDTENCDSLRSKKNIAESVEPGKSYDLTGTGIFSYNKVVTEAHRARP